MPSTPVHLPPSHTCSSDPYVIEDLVRAAQHAMEHSAFAESMTPSEVLSACFTLLDRSLRTMAKLQAPEDRVTNIRAVNSVLSEMLLEHGCLPN